MEWISVEDNPPTENKKYLVTNGIEVTIMKYWGVYKDSHDWESCDCSMIYPSHWMPLPEPAKDVE